MDPSGRPESRSRSPPPGLSINELFDQSKLVAASIEGVVREGVIAAGLTGLMILLSQARLRTIWLLLLLHAFFHASWLF